MELEQVSKYFLLEDRYMYDKSEMYSFWQVVPILTPKGTYKVGLLTPDGEWERLTYLSDSYTSASGAIAVGKAFIDLRHAELDAESEAATEPLLLPPL